MTRIVKNPYDTCFIVLNSDSVPLTISIDINEIFRKYSEKIDKLYKECKWNTSSYSYTFEGVVIDSLKEFVDVHDIKENAAAYLDNIHGKFHDDLPDSFFVKISSITERITDELIKLFEMIKTFNGQDYVYKLSQRNYKHDWIVLTTDKPTRQQRAQLI